MKNLNSLTEAVHANALKHGWWENKPSTEHCLMLVVTEIAEMVEADRKGNVAVINHIRKQRNLAAAQKCRLIDDVDSAPDFIAAFDEMVKNTVEDEMADVVIRLLDLAGAFGLDFDKLTPNKYHRAFDRFSFTENAFALTKGLCRESINIFKRIQFGIHYMTLWAESQGVNLDWHVRAKMRYNVTRPYKHGKKVLMQVLSKSNANAIQKDMARMKYLVIITDPVTGDKSAFYTDWFQAENHFNPEVGMVVIDQTQHLVTFDGETWQDIEDDHL